MQKYSFKPLLFLAVFLTLGFNAGVAKAADLPTINALNAAVPGLSPSSALVGSQDVTVTINGSNFTNNSLIFVDDAFYSGATYISPTKLTFTISEATLTVVGPLSVTVSTSSGSTVMYSNAETFTVTDPPPTPVAFDLTVNKTGTGTGIVTSSPEGIICGNYCIETYDSGTVVTLTATPTLGSTFAGWSGACTGLIGTCTVIMNANKNVLATFNVMPTPLSNPVPTINLLDAMPPGLSPSSATIGDPATPIVITGTGFIPTSLILNDSISEFMITDISPTQIKATIPAPVFAFLKNPDGGFQGIDADTFDETFKIKVFNPLPGGGTSNAVTFTIKAPVPIITSISLTSIGKGGPDLPLIVKISGFGKNPVVRVDGVERESDFYGLSIDGESLSLKIILSAAELASPGAHSITVFNPAPGGGTSNAVTFTVTNVPAKFGTLVISKYTKNGDALFKFRIHDNDLFNFNEDFSTINGFGSTQIELYEGLYSTDEFDLPDDWRLDGVLSPFCIIEGIPTGSLAFNGVNDFSIKSDKVTICSFYNIYEVFEISSQALTTPTTTTSTTTNSLNIISFFQSLLTAAVSGAMLFKVFKRG